MEGFLTLKIIIVMVIINAGETKLDISYPCIKS